MFVSFRDFQEKISRPLFFSEFRNMLCLNMLRRVKSGVRPGTEFRRLSFEDHGDNFSESM